MEGGDGEGEGGDRFFFYIKRLKNPQKKLTKTQQQNSIKTQNLTSKKKMNKTF